ncbi:hypothetical protein [Corynebacterium glyciniphilum]
MNSAMTNPPGMARIVAIVAMSMTRARGGGFFSGVFIGLSGGGVWNRI